MNARVVLISLTLASVGSLPSCRVRGLKFKCASDSQCGSAGRCIANACAFPSNCPSGYRYDSSAGAVAGQCVQSTQDAGTEPGGSMDMSVDMSIGSVADMSQRVDFGHSPDDASAGAPTCSWKRYTITAPVMGVPINLWASGPKDIYVTALGTGPAVDIIYHSVDGVNFGSEYIVPVEAANHYVKGQFWGSDPHNLFQNSSQGILHSDGGGTWSVDTSLVPNFDTSNLYTIQGWSPSEFYASDPLGTAPTVYHFKAGSYTVESIPSTSISYFWGTGTNDVYGAGGGFTGTSVIYHSTGDGVWTATNYQGGVWPQVGWSASPTDVYVAGVIITGNNGEATGQIYHSSGDGNWDSLPQLSVPVTMSFSFIYGTSPTNIYAGGTAMYHSNGDGSWSSDPTLNGMGDNFYGMWSDSSEILALAYSPSSKTPIMWICR